MRTGTRRAKLALLSVMAVTATVAAMAAPAQAAVGCGTRTTTTPFSRFGDANKYFFAPNGGFESGSASWSLSGGSVVSGNESFYLHAGTDRYALNLPTGSVASSAFMCITKDDPSVRFVARATGSPYTSLNVSATLRNSQGTTQSVYLGQLSASSFGSWGASPIYSYSVQLNMPWMLINGVAEVSFSFSSQGSAGAWQIDDVYVDPFKGT
jgi:hypothetical protein